MQLNTGQEGLVEQGHPACAGCGMVLGVRHILEEAGEDTTLVIPASCASVIQGVYPYTAFDVPVINTAFAAGPSTASGVQMAVENRDEDTNVMVIAGDGGSSDIGLASLSGFLERDHDVTYVLYDNEAYSNTGFQKSGRTPPGATTTTTPTGRKGKQKDIARIVSAHDPAYMATASPGFVQDLRRKARKALDAEGASFIHLLSPCPPGWRIDTGDTITVGQKAVETGLWVLYERERGGEFTVNQPSKSAFRNPGSVEEYVGLQGRFKNATTEDVEAMEELAASNIEEFSRYVEGSK
ncbi:thiamine pyrophosphate-dependent enzyme [Halobacteriaceae archaeon GCM10025711]